jgi:hypothetical protein
MQPSTSSPGKSTVPAETSAPPAIVSGQNQTANFGRAAMAILVAMVLLIVALTGILVETTWRSQAGEVEVLPPSADPGSFARR